MPTILPDWSFNPVLRFSSHCFRRTSYSLCGISLSRLLRCPSSVVIANPGAACSRGSGGSLSSFFNAIGPGCGAFAAWLSKYLNNSAMPAQTAAVEIVSTTTNVSTPRTLTSLASCVTSTLRMCETSGVSVLCPLPLCFSAISLMPHMHLLERRFKLRIVNRNQRPFTQLPRKQRQPQTTKTEQCNYIH